MKKMRKHGWAMMMPVVWAACVLGSCKNEVDDVFDRDATSRIEAAITECDNMLQSSEYGWRFDYTPTNSAMVNYVMRFKDGRVTMENAEAALRFSAFFSSAACFFFAEFLSLSLALSRRFSSLSSSFCASIDQYCSLAST